MSVTAVLERGRARRTDPAVVAAAALIGAAVVGVVAAHTVRPSVSALVGVVPYVLVAMVAIPVLVAIAARPQLGVLLLAALVPFNGLLILVHSKPAAADGWKEGLALYALLWAALSRVGHPRPRRGFPKYVQPLLAYFLVALISAAVVGGLQGLEGVKIGFFWALVGLIVWLAPFDARDRDRFVTILMVVGLVTSVYGLAQQKIGAARLVSLGYSYDSNVRFTGRFVRSFSSFPNPFNFGFFLVIVLVLAVPICLEEPRRPRNLLFLLSTPVLLVALGFTFVRGAWLALAVGLFYVGFKRYKALAVLVPIVLIAAILLPGAFTSSALQSRSFDERQSGWSENLSKVISAPLGNGIGTTGASGEKVASLEGNSTLFVYQPDNQYFKVLYELGVLGLWLFVFMFIAILVTARRAEVRVAPRDHPFAIGVTGVVLGAIVASFVATWWEIFPNDLFLWLLLAVVVTATHESS
jgi:O-antigen ligase